MANKVNIRQEDMQMRIINLPTSILTKCKDKNILFSVAIALFVKAHSGDSMFRNTSVRNIRDKFGVGQVRARKIINAVKNNNTYFKYNKYTDAFVAKTFKNKTIVSDNKFGKKIWSMYVVRLVIDKDWSLLDIEKYVHDMIYLHAINATERSDKFYSCREIKNNILLTTKDALTLNKMKNIGGVCKSTARRQLLKLQANNMINIKQGYTQLVLSSVCEGSIRESGLEHVNIVYDRKRGFGYIVVPNQYKITNRSITQSFRNIIFNHKKRQTFNAKTKEVDIMETPLMAAYA